MSQSSTTSRCRSSRPYYVLTTLCTVVLVIWIAATLWGNLVNRGLIDRLEEALDSANYADGVSAAELLGTVHSSRLKWVETGIVGEHKGMTFVIANYETSEGRVELIIADDQLWAATVLRLGDEPHFKKYDFATDAMQSLYGVTVRGTHY